VFVTLMFLCGGEGIRIHDPFSSRMAGYNSLITGTENYHPGSVKSTDLGLGIDDPNLDRISASLNRQRLNNLLGKSDPLDDLLKSTSASLREEPLEKELLGPETDAERAAVASAAQNKATTDESPAISLSAVTKSRPRLQQKTSAAATTESTVSALSSRVDLLEKKVQAFMEQERADMRQIQAVLHSTRKKKRRWGTYGENNQEIPGTEEDGAVKQNVMTALAQTIKMLRKKQEQARESNEIGFDISAEPRFLDIGEYRPQSEEQQDARGDSDDADDSSSS